MNSQLQPIDPKVYCNMLTTAAAHPLSFAIGQFLVNCGLLEFETYVWIHGFGSADLSNAEECKKELFAARIRRILRIMNGLPIVAEAKTGIQEVWDEAAEIMQMRNIVAHNPIIAQYNGPGAKPEWFIRVIDAKTMGSGNLKEYVVSDIDAWTDRAHDLSKRIFNLREVIGGGQIKVNYIP